MDFWQMAYNSKWIAINALRLAVKTDANPYGAITSQEFDQITGKRFDALDS